MAGLLARMPLTARNFDRQVAGFQIGVAVINGFVAVGIPVNVFAGWVGTKKKLAVASGVADCLRFTICLTTPQFFMRRYWREILEAQQRRIMPRAP